MLEKQTQSSALANPSWHRGCDTLFTEMIPVEDPKNTEKTNRFAFKVHCWMSEVPYRLSSILFRGLKKYKSTYLYIWFAGGEISYENPAKLTFCRIFLDV